jgi:hypothetical protein
MTKSFILFDMDGVLLKPLGYHQSLQSMVIRIGHALGAPNTNLTLAQIAKFESLGVSNEWDSLAISTALILINLWQMNPDLRLSALTEIQPLDSKTPPGFDAFLERFNYDDRLPCESALLQLLSNNQWLNPAQKSQLEDILLNSRDIYNSPIMRAYQETVLGSNTFQENYGLEPQLGIESFLSKYDKPMMTPTTKAAFTRWLSESNHYAGIMTNRPSACPPGYLSSPEAELGAVRAGVGDLPMIGSGLLAWYAKQFTDLPEYKLLKPNPVHALGLMLRILGQPPKAALDAAVQLWQGEGQKDVWQSLNNSKIIIFEDSVNGLACGQAAQNLFQQNGVCVDLTKIGISNDPNKIKALETQTDIIMTDINAVNWQNFK